MPSFFSRKKQEIGHGKFIAKHSSKVRLIILAIFILAFLAGSLDYPAIWDKAADYLNSEISLGLPHFYKLPFRLGLDLQGGTHLVYQADLSSIEEKERSGSMDGIRDVIERRVNLFGVAEPLVQINKAGDSYRLIVELPGVKDIHQAIKMIGETPYLEFKEERTQQETDDILGRQQAGDEKAKQLDPYFKSTSLTGRYLKKSQLEFDQTTYEPQVGLEFNDEGAKLFSDITSRNVGKRVAIYLDGAPITTPVVQEAIAGGRAQITGNFTAEEAKQLVGRLNAGALPVPITLISQQSVGASLGKISLTQSLKAGLIGLIAVVLFMIIYYRLPGILGVITLGIYGILVLAIFKLIPVTLTLSGIAGFIMSLGMAVDANVLIFERMKEELKAGRSFEGSISEGVKRAWPSIRDGNLTTLITTLILFWFGSSVIKGFALTLSIGVLVSMFTAMVITRIFLKLFIGGRLERVSWLFKGALRNKQD